MSTGNIPNPSVELVTPSLDQRTPALDTPDNHTRILSGEGRAPQPQPGWVPVLVEGNPSLQEEPKPEPDDGGGDSNPPPPPPPPQNPPPGDEPGASPSAPAASGGGVVTRKIVEWNINVTSSDGSVHPEVFRQLRQMMRQEIQEAKDDELNSLSIQEGYA